MAPFDASYIKDEALNAEVIRSFAMPSQADDANYGRYSLSADAVFKSPISYAELEEVMTAPAMRTESYAEYLLQRLDRHGALTAVLFIGAYAAVMSAL
jgi:hypothetical protein